MDTKASSMLFLALLLLFSATTSSSAFNISKLLDQHPNFSNFNKHLKDTNLADQINTRSTITVLALDNDAFSSISGQSQDVLKKILAAHVVLDYYDNQKISKLGLSKKPTTLTTLFQASGHANGEQGFIKVGLVKEGDVAFGSAVKGGSLNAKLVDSVTSQPYNISVLQVSEAIEIPGINADASSTSPAASPSPSKSAKSPSPSSKDKEVVEAPAPSDDEDSEIASPPEEEGEMSPEEAPVRSPPAPEPTAANAPAPASSAASPAAEMAVGAVIMGLVSVLVA